MTNFKQSQICMSKAWLDGVIVCENATSDLLFYPQKDKNLFRFNAIYHQKNCEITPEKYTAQKDFYSATLKEEKHLTLIPVHSEKIGKQKIFLYFVEESNPEVIYKIDPIDFPKITSQHLEEFSLYRDKNNLSSAYLCYFDEDTIVIY